MTITSEEKEYELIPISPLRRLEKRIEKLEASYSGVPNDIFKDVIDIMRMNQQLVDELAKSNDALRIELSKLPAKLDELIANLKELISFIKSSGEEEAVGITQEAMKPLVEKMDELVKANKTASETNEAMLELLNEINKRLKRPVKPMAGALLHMERIKRPKPIKM